MSADEAIAELAASLSVEETPVKLRCATCSQIAYNALRMPCCEQNICEICFNELEDMCHVCHHEPLDKSLCTPNKSLRITTKVFLKKKMIDKAREQKKEEEAAKAAAAQATEGPLPSHDKVTASPTPAEGPSGPLSEATENGWLVKSDEISTPQPAAPEASVDQEGPRNGSPSAGVDVPQQSVEISTEESKAFDEAHVGDDKPVRPMTQDSKDGKGEHTMQNGQWSNGVMPNMMAGMNGMNSAFPMDFSPMMPNGMQMPGGFPNMMGMGMDPTMMTQMSSIFGGLGGPTMGMNGMGTNMGMGFNGQGQFDGPWMGQDAFNANGHGNGNFGGQGGYNMPSHQSNFNQMNHQQYSQNDFSNGYGRQGFQNRGGRGRRGGFYNGGPGRNYPGQMNSGNQRGYANQNSTNNHAYSQQAYQQQRHMGSAGSTNVYSDSAKAQAQTEPADEAEEARMTKELAPGGEVDDDQAVIAAEKQSDGKATGTGDYVNSGTANGLEESDRKTTEASYEPTEAAGADLREDIKGASETMVEDGRPLPIQTFMSDESGHARSMPPPGPNALLGPSGRGFARGFHPSNGVSANIPPMTIPVVASTTPIGVGVAGAPTGPRALREGFPNTTRSSFPARSQAASSVVSGSGRDRTKSPSPTRRSRSLSGRSPSRQRSDHRRRERRRTRSRSPSDRAERVDEKEHRRSLRHYDDEPDRAADESSSKRSSHRSRRHDRESQLSGHRHHRDRSYARDREREKDKERDRDRDRDRRSDLERDQERTRERDPNESRDERRHRRRRSKTPILDSAGPTPTSTCAPDLSGEKIGSHKRHSRDEETDRDRDRERDRESGYDRHERKRSRRNRSPSQDRRSSYYQPTSHDSSKPATPARPIFPPLSRRDSNASNGVPAASNEPSAKIIPTGPKASFHVSRKSRDRDYERGQKHGRARDCGIARQSSTNGGTGHDSAPPSKAPEKDPHTLEREARDRERLMKEMQRRATMDGPKRKSNTISRNGSRGPARRSSVKYEDEGGEEARRVELEREGARWR